MIRPMDAVIVCARNEDDVSHLEACCHLSLSLIQKNLQTQTPQAFIVHYFCTNRFGYMRIQTKVIQTCMFTMISSFQHFHFALHGLTAHLEGEKKVRHMCFGTFKVFVDYLSISLLCACVLPRSTSIF